MQPKPARLKRWKLLPQKTDQRPLLLLLGVLSSNGVLGAGGLESTDRPSEQPLLLPAPNLPPKPDLFTLPPAQSLAPDSNLRKRNIAIRRIILEGNTVLPAEALQNLIQPYKNSTVSVAQLEELRQAITKLYQDRGYINSGAIISEGALREDELKITLIEGRVKEAKIKGQGNLREGYIRNRLLAEPEHTFNIHDLEDRFQVLLSDPLISRLNGRVLPGPAFGQGILDVEVARTKPYKLTLFGDNYRPPSVGANALGATGSLLSPFGFGEIFDFTYSISEGANRYGGGLNLPVSDHGAMAFFRFDEADSRVREAPFQNLNINSRVHSLEGGLSQLLINTQARRLNLGATLAIRKNETSLLGEPFSFTPGVLGAHTQATVLRINQDFLQRFDRHALAARSTFSIGLNALGATQPREDFPSSDFFAWLGQAQYAFRLNQEGAQLVFKSNSQFCNHALLPLEKIAVGGFSTVRGYRTNSLVRDNGYTLSTELHYPLLAYRGLDPDGRLELAPFMDYGEAWDLKTSWEPNAQANALWSIGLGMQWRHANYAADFSYGYALNKLVKSQAAFDALQDNGIYFQVRMDVL